MAVRNDIENGTGVNARELPTLNPNGGDREDIENCTGVNVRGLSSFNPNGDSTALSSKWKVWKRAFNLYLISKNITNDQQKLALLLHTGGLDFQELYYSLVPETEQKTYDEGITVLTNHFTPQCNEPFERHLFRQMEQKEGETIAQFVCRLRRKVANCNFHNVDECIRDQLIDKCRNVSLRRKFLEQTGNVTLANLESVARSFEAVEKQMECMNSPTQPTDVNAINTDVNVIQKYGKNLNSTSDSGRNRTFNRGNNSSNKSNEVTCYRCGNKGHMQRDENCPAKKAECSKCGIRGHFASRCRTDMTNYRRRNRAYNVEEPGPADDFAFTVYESVYSLEGKTDFGVAVIS